MRRNDREVTATEEIRAILDACKVFRIAMAVGNIPYLVPLNYGYRWENGQLTFCFHCADSGKKLDLLRENPLVCFELDGGHALAEADTPCAYGYYYKSIIGMGEVTFVTDPGEKADCLSLLMHHQTGRDFAFTPEQAAAVTVCTVRVTELTAKQRTRR